MLKASIDLDVNAMEEYWKNAKDQNYSFLGHNCSDAVIKVLEAGNDDFLLAPQAFAPNLFAPNREPKPNWTQRDYIIWIHEKLAGFRLQGVHHAFKR